MEEGKTKEQMQKQKRETLAVLQITFFEQSAESLFCLFLFSIKLQEYIPISTFLWTDQRAYVGLLLVILRDQIEVAVNKETEEKK